jgi:hypothetical protein
MRRKIPDCFYGISQKAFENILEISRKFKTHY